MIKAVAPMGLGLISPARGYKGFAPTELIQPIPEQSRRDGIFVDQRINNNISPVGATPKEE